jgi:hypothetical protein
MSQEAGCNACLAGNRSGAIIGRRRKEMPGALNRWIRTSRAVARPVVQRI